MNRYLITGATGYIGSMLTTHLIKDPSATVTVIVRDVARAKVLLPDNVEIIQADITDASKLQTLQTQCFDYIIHCASPTKSSYMLANPSATSTTIIEGTRNILEIARYCNSKSVVFLSSMEVYGNIDCSDGHRVTEDETGYIDANNPRSCYPLGKLTAEELCHSYCREYGVPVKIARLAQTFGKGVLPEDTRVFMQFVNAVLSGTDIILHTTGNSMGNYCEINDALNGILTILHKGNNGEAYNVVNESNTMRIREMSELVASEIAHNNISVIYDIPDDNRYGYAADTGLKLSSAKLMALGWHPTHSLKEMYQDIISERKDIE